MIEHDWTRLDTTGKHWTQLDTTKHDWTTLDKILPPLGGGRGSLGLGLLTGAFLLPRLLVTLFGLLLLLLLLLLGLLLGGVSFERVATS